jgi:hypothetical protein
VEANINFVVEPEKTDIAGKVFIIAGTATSAQPANSFDVFVAPLGHIDLV